MACWQLTRNGGPNPLWGLGTTNGADYHSPRQVGFGRVTGTGTAFSANNGVNGSTDSITYVGDSEPVYIWGNNGTTTWYASDYSTPTSNEDSAANYIQAGRDILTSAKSGYTTYTYPHPLEVYASGGSGGGGATAPQFTLAVVNGSGSGSYDAGSIVSISAAPIPTEYFTNWSGLYVAQTNSANTTVTMPATNITVKANIVPYAPTQLIPMSGP